MKENKKIIVAAYNPKWKTQFDSLKTVLLAYLEEEIIAIEHVGSTSIEGLKAKPIIDLDIIIKEDAATMKQVIGILSKLGYKHLGNLGVIGREAFKRKNDKTPNNGSNKDWFKHNLYLCPEGSMGLQNHLNFRNYLRQHREKIKEYGQLKQALAEKFPYNIDAYIDGKTAFIIDILNKTGMDNQDLQTINLLNKMKEC